MSTQPTSHESAEQADLARAFATAMTMRRFVVTEGAHRRRRTAEVHLVDGRRLVVVPLHRLGQTDEQDAAEFAADWEWAWMVKDVGGDLVDAPDAADGEGRSSRDPLWWVAVPGTDVGVGIAATEKLMWARGLLPQHGVEPGESAKSYAETPYPGARPAGSWVVDAAERLFPVMPDSVLPSGWSVVTADDAYGCLDAWLDAAGAAALADRMPLLSYGSNGCPRKFVGNGVSLPGVNLAVVTEGLAAAHCAGTRSRDGAVPATLVAAAGAAEPHVVSYVLASDIERLDRVEGRTSRWYDLVRLEEGRVLRADGVEVEGALAYVGSRPERWPLVDADGSPLLVAATPQGQAHAAVVGRSGRSAEPTGLGSVIPLAGR